NGKSAQQDLDLRLPLSWTAIRTQEVPQVAITGALSGAIFGRLSGGSAGQGRTVRWAIVCTLGSTAIKLAANEFEVQRIKYVSRGRQQEREQLPEPVYLPPLPEAEPFSRKIWSWLGVKQVTSEEHLEKLRAERDMIWREIQRLEREGMTEQEKEQS
ncbi:hypothetical protein K488DRAFT_59387, partial [Vararia minispora EC-137]